MDQSFEPSFAKALQTSRSCRSVDSYHRRILISFPAEWSYFLLDHMKPPVAKLSACPDYYSSRRYAAFSALAPLVGSKRTEVSDRPVFSSVGRQQMKRSARMENCEEIFQGFMPRRIQCGLEPGRQTGRKGGSELNGAKMGGCEEGRQGCSPRS